MALLDADVKGRGVHVYKLGDPQNGIWVNGSSIDRTGVTKGEVRNYAKGKRRAITWGATDRTLTLNLNYNLVAAYEVLEGWLDEVVVVRSVRGEVVAGLMAELSYMAEATLATEFVGGSMMLQATTDDGTLEGVRRR